VVYRFDDFTLDTATRRLLRTRAERHLSPKAFDLLHFLVANRSRAVSKAELLQQLWPSTHVLETNLAGLVAEIRQALGDSAEKPRYLRTVHRFGYWFVGPVEEPAGGGASGVPLRCWLMLESRQVALSEGEAILGRAPDATVWIDVPGVSRHHARIVIDGSQATVEDLGSKNGTFLGGRRVSAPSPLGDGDEIRLGSVVVTFRIPPPAQTTSTVRTSSRG
jgi:DNA-binding winged helix-turn-helix (wHTH) protein